MYRWDWDELMRILAAVVILTLSGMTLAFFGGWLVIKLLYEAFLGGGL